MPTVKGISTQYDLLPAGRNPYYHQPPPSTAISGFATRKVSPPTIIDADTVILDTQVSDWLAVAEPAHSSTPPSSFKNEAESGDFLKPAPFYWRLALQAYAHQTPACAPFLTSGRQINFVA